MWGGLQMRRLRLSFPCYERCAILCHVLEEKKKKLLPVVVFSCVHMYIFSMSVYIA